MATHFVATENTGAGDPQVRAGLGGREAIQARLNLVMSACMNDPLVLEPAHHGFKGVLTKPFNGAKRQEILARVMGH